MPRSRSNEERTWAKPCVSSQAIRRRRPRTCRPGEGRARRATRRAPPARARSPRRDRAGASSRRPRRPPRSRSRFPRARRPPPARRRRCTRLLLRRHVTGAGAGPRGILRQGEGNQRGTVGGRGGSDRRRPCILLTFRSACRGNAPRRAGDRRIDRRCRLPRSPPGRSTPTPPSATGSRRTGRTRSRASGRGAAPTARGVRVCIVDSGVDADHPLVRRHRPRGRSGDGRRTASSAIADDDAGDVSGHGTACAGIIRSLAPGCVDHERPRARARTSAARRPTCWPGSRGRSSSGFDVISLSLSTRKRAVVPRPARARRPGLLRAARCWSRARTTCRSRASRGASPPCSRSPGTPGATRSRSTATPPPPVEFYARGVDVEVAWSGGSDDHRNGQLLRDAAPGRRLRAHPRRPPRADALPGQAPAAT